MVKNGYRLRDFIGLPAGGKKTIIRMKVQRYKFKNESCDYDSRRIYLSLLAVAAIPLGLPAMLLVFLM